MFIPLISGAVLLYLLVAVPTAIFAIQCWQNGFIEDDGKPRAVVQKSDCADKEEYCYKSWYIDENTNKTVTHKQCGDGLCTSEFCDLEKLECCCKGNFCNGAAGSSVLVTSLIVAVAAWLRQ